MRILIGIVGYCGFVRGYPLGPELMERLLAVDWPVSVEIREMNWGPVAIVQDFQANADKPERVILVGALDRGLAQGSVSRRRWAGGALDAASVQRRMFEAVTGVISLDNLLVIGAQFGVWPTHTYCVELQWPESGLGDLVLGELEEQRLNSQFGGQFGRQSSGQVVGEAPISPANAFIVAQLVEAVRALALDESSSGVQALTVEQLTPVAPVLQHRFVEHAGLKHHEH